MPIVHTATNVHKSRGFIALRNMTSDGRESVVTAIMKLSTVPSRAPL